MENLVVVLGKNYSTTLGTVRALGERGYKTHVCFISKSQAQGKIVSSSRYVSRFFLFRKRDERLITDFLIGINRGRSEKIPLIATDDYTASLVDRHLNELTPYFFLPGSENGEGEIVRMMDKAVQCELALRFGLRAARSWTLKEENGVYPIPEDMVYPCFFKPLVSFVGGKDGMICCNSQAELRDGLLAFSRVGGIPVLVQEYLKIDHEYSISGICWGEQVFLPALLRKLRVCQSHKGTTVMGVIEPFDQESEIYKRLTKLLASLKLKCIVDVEFFRCGDEMIFNEINFRTSAVCYGIVAGGANLPAMFAEAQQSGNFNPGENDISYGARFLCEKAAWDDYISEIISAKELKKLYSGSNYFIIRNTDDPKPESVFLCFVVMRKIKHFIMSRLKK